MTQLRELKKSGGMGIFMQGHKKWNEHTFDDYGVDDSFKSIVETEFYSLGI